MRRAVSFVVSALLAVSVLGAIAVWAAGSSKQPARIVRGAISLDEKEFFGDPRVNVEFAKHGLHVQVHAARDRRLASSVAAPNDDFDVVVEAPAAQQNLTALPAAKRSVPFSTPMAVATFTGVAQALARAGVARDHGGWWTLDMKGFLDLVARQVHWNQLLGNSLSRSTKLVTITSTNATTSNAARMYASIASYVANRESVVDSPGAVDDVVNRVSPLFVKQSIAEQSTTTLFDDYLSKGEDTTEMMMISEAQFVARAAGRPSRIRPNMVLMYPNPDVLSKYTVVSRTAAGEEVGRLLTEDPTLRQLAVEHGFRTMSQPGAFSSFTRRNNVAVAPQVPDLIEPPTDDILGALMLRIDAALHVTLGPSLGLSVSNDLLNLPAPITGP